MDKTKTVVNVVKVVGGVVISIGVGAIVANLIRATTPEDVKKITKVCIGVGSFFVAGMTAAAASKRFDNSLDTIISMVTKFIMENDESEEELVVEVEI